MRVSTRAKRVWKRLVGYYGTRLTESYGPQPPEDWCEMIDRADDERLEAALMAVRREHVKHPPTLGEFESCIPKKKRIDLSAPSVSQQLANFVIANRKTCRHQRFLRWSYFGPEKQFERGKAAVNHPETHGVVVPACPHADCEDGGGASLRVTVEDLPQSEAAA